MDIIIRGPDQAQNAALANIIHHLLHGGVMDITKSRILNAANANLDPSPHQVDGANVFLTLEKTE